MTNKPAAAPNYPDVLGLLTGDQRQTLDVMEFALATRPTVINAGKPFEVIILMQNTANVDVDAVMKIVLPEKDLSGKAGRFATPNLKPIRIGLRPGEVGFANIPVSATALTAPGEGYKIEIEAQVEYKSKTLSRIRDPQHRQPFSAEAMNPTLRPAFDSIAELYFQALFSARGGGKAVPSGPNTTKAIFAVQFSLMPAMVTGLPPELKAGYTPIWLESDLSRAASISSTSLPTPTPEAPEPDSEESPLARILATLDRTTAFFPLLREIQARYDAAHYRLWAGEAVMIAKLLSHVLELGGPTVISGYPGPYQPRWYRKLDVLVRRDPSLADRGTAFLAEIYPDLAYDASLLAFTLLRNATGEEFGTAGEIDEYSQDLINTLGGGMVDLSRAYLPLVLGGLIVHAEFDLTMPQERPGETVDLVLRAAESRLSEQTEQNDFVFGMAQTLIERARR